MTRPDFTTAIRKVNASYAKAPVSRWTNVHDSQPCNKKLWDKHVRQLAKEKAAKEAQPDIAPVKKLRVVKKSTSKQKAS